MSSRIEYLPSQSHAPWSVRFGTKRVQFQDEKSAKDYAAKLKDRIEAPHVYPRREKPESTHGR